MKKLYFKEKYYILILVFFQIIFMSQSLNGQTIYKGDSVELSLATGYRGSIQWQESADGTFWSDITGGTVNNMIVKPLSNTQYRAVVSEMTCDPIYTDVRSVIVSKESGIVVGTPVANSFNAVSASVQGEVKQVGGIAKVVQKGTCWSTSNNPTVNDSKTSDGAGIGLFTSTISGLTANTTYFLRTYALTDDGVTLYSPSISIRTLELVTIDFVPVRDISTVSAVSGGVVKLNGTETVTARGVCWNTSQNPIIANSKTADGTGEGTYASSLNNLLPEKVYYLRAYVTTSNGITYYSSQTSFETLPAYNFAIQTGTVSGVSFTNGGTLVNIQITGPGTVSTRGVCWNTTPLPTISNSKTVNGSGPGNFTASITGLTSGTLYYMRAYATSATGKTFYGNEVSFTTLESISINTEAITAITTSSAVSGGTVTDLASGLVTVVRRGVCWSTGPSPLAGTNNTSDGSGTGKFSSTITGLNPMTKYYVRAYAELASGKIIYGNENSFTTAQPLAINISTHNATNITATGAVSGGDITTTGFGSVTERGVCWSLAQNPTVADYKNTGGVGSGSYTSTLTGLNPGSIYYLRAYAITDSDDIVYGNQISITLPSPVTITTSAVTELTSVSATSGGAITVLITGTTISARGVCWSEFPNPTINNSFTASGSGVGAFSTAVKGLNGSKNYYARAYCTTNIGVVYGNEITFTTPQPPPADLQLVTDNVSLITDKLGYCTAQITGTSAVTQRGFCWGKKSNPTTADSKTIFAFPGQSKISGDLTGLEPLTTYYVRSYAVAATGATYYGNQVSFTTVKETVIEVPVVTTISIENLNSTLAFVRVKADGVSFAKLGVAISTSPNAVVEGITGITNVFGDFDYVSFFSGLNPGTKYYVRGYVLPGSENDYKAPVYGNELSFTTLPQESTKYAVKTVDPVISVPYETSLPMVISGGVLDGPVGALSNGLTNYGYCWSKVPNPTVETGSKETIAMNTYAMGEYFRTYPIRIPIGPVLYPEPVEYSSSYYLRTFITLRSGEVIYGNQVMFTTPAAPNFEISTANASGGNANEFNVKSNVTVKGSETIVARGVCWKPSHDPTVSDPHTSNGTSSGEITVKTRPIEYGIRYYFRSYVIGSSGRIYYGNEISYGTDAPEQPDTEAPGTIDDPNPNPNPALTVITNNVSSVTGSGATFSGSISGGSKVTERGFCFATTQNPTTRNARITYGSGLGNFSGSISGLISGTRYYVRAYAVSASGTTYGNQVSFVTQSTNTAGGDMLLTYIVHGKDAKDCAQMSKGYYAKVIYAKNEKSEREQATNTLKDRYGASVDFTSHTTKQKFAAVIQYVYKMSGWNCLITVVTIGYGSSANEALNNAVKNKNSVAGTGTDYTILRQIQW
ncbi:hypothetical protein K6T82_11355 [Flavobacterium sp. 17A]|uniref:Fibronectin type-III domain-containing protein n=1 Tax=Flavobacterium potami TaxID=2872310 RepID=A0A9X1KQC8_9FLAO|nr:hypothetical protein [Flavobacterium potami]MBZ4035365.1 hypothetical protein [Flavobacterium potami]